MVKGKKAKEGNDYKYLTIFIIFISLAFGTFLHDPILHSIVAIANGWELSEYQSGLMTGETTVIATASQASGASTFSFWLYFMFPSLFIYILTMIITILKQDRLLRVAGVVLLSLNLPSLNPEISGSDSYNAVQFLVTRGWTELSAGALHYSILLGALVVYGLYLYIIIEDSNKDSRTRTQNIMK